MKNNLRYERIKQNKLLKDVSKDLNIPVNTLSNYERGDREPKLETWVKLADYFGVDVAYLQGLSNIRHLDGNRPYYENTDEDFDIIEHLKKINTYKNKVGQEYYEDEGNTSVMLEKSNNLSKILKVVQETESDNFDDEIFDLNNAIGDLSLRANMYDALTDIIFSIPNNPTDNDKIFFKLLKNIIKNSSEYYLIKNYGQAQDSSMDSIEELEKLKRLYKENLDKSIQSFTDFI